MCLNKIVIKNKSKYVDISNGYRALVTCNCGQCAECKQAKQNEYSLRSFIEYKTTQNQLHPEHFTYFETLTYNNENLPKFHNVPCFNRKHYVDFMKRLRINLTREGYDVKNHLKYFFVCEYGSFKHRPHYHVIFFSTIDGLSVYKFARHVRNAWQFGFTDSLYTVNNRVVNGVGAIHYVAKYVTKDDDFVSTFDKKKEDAYNNYLRYIGDPSTKSLAEHYHEVYTALDKQEDENGRLTIYPFHRQSQGFGLRLEVYNNIAEVIKTGKCRMEDKRNVYKFVELPMYHKRKYFYKLQDDVFNYGMTEETYKHWVLTPLGRAWKLEQLNNSIIKTTERYENLYHNLSAYVGEKSHEMQKEIDNLLNGRTFMDLSIYELVYKGTMFQGDLLDYSSHYDLSISQFDRPLLYINEEDNYLYDSHFNSPTGINYVEFIKLAINEDSYQDFENFDRLIAYCRRITRKYDEGKQRKYREQQNAIRKLNQLKKDVHSQT